MAALSDALSIHGIDQSSVILTDLGLALMNALPNAFHNHTTSYASSISIRTLLIAARPVYQQTCGESLSARSRVPGRRQLSRISTYNGLLLCRSLHIRQPRRTLRQRGSHI